MRGEEQTAQAYRVLLRVDALFCGAGAELAEAAVGEAVEPGLQVTAPGGPYVLGQPGVTAPHGPRDPVTRLGRGPVRPGVARAPVAIATSTNACSPTPNRAVSNESRRGSP